MQTTIIEIAKASALLVERVEALKQLHELGPSNAGQRRAARVCCESEADGLEVGQDASQMHRLDVAQVEQVGVHEEGHKFATVKDG